VVCKSQLAIASGLLVLLSQSGKRKVAVVQAFIDESGTDERSPVLSVAGFSGTLLQWERFLELWAPFSERFHAKDAEWLFKDLCVAIEESDVRGVLVTVEKECFRAANAHFRTVFGNAYASCALLCATHIYMLADRPVSFVVEHGQPNVEFVRRTLEALMDVENSKIAAVTTAKKYEFIQLHTADFVSHIASSYDVVWMRRLFEAGKLEHTHVTEDILRTTSEEVSELFKKARRIRRANRAGV
jgi:hypothetical protein